MPPTTDVRLVDLLGHFKHLPHQLAAATELEEDIKAGRKDALSRSRPWYATWSQAGKQPGPSESQPGLVTMAQATAVFERSPSHVQLWDLNACLMRFDIDTPERIRHFMAQICHESGGLKWLKELADGSDYEGREDLGNIHPGDGRRFKGTGALQMTGRANYQAFADYMGDQRVMMGVDFVADTYPFTSAGFWWSRYGMNELVDAGATCKQVSKRVNGRDPANGLQEREAAYERACRAI